MRDRETSVSVAPRVTGAAVAVLLAGFLSGCDRTNGDTIVVNGLDCGLVRADLTGTWTVTFSAAGATLTNCQNATFNGTAVGVGSGSTQYSVGQDVIASPSGSAFTALGVGPNALANELMASVEADSCLALVQVWDQTDKGWVQCLGTLDRTTRLISTVCDAMDLDTNADGQPDNACDLSVSFRASVALSP